MAPAPKTPTRSHRVMGLVRQRINRAGERLWRYEDFRGLPFSAVAQALSRLTREGTIERLSKGVYYRNRETTFGKSRPNPSAIRNLASRRNTLFPAGMAAANLLGFTTQMPKQGEISTNALSLPRKLVGSDTLIHTRRPEAWTNLSETDATDIRPGLYRTSYQYGNNFASSLFRLRSAAVASKLKRVAR